MKAPAIVLLAALAGTRAFAQTVELPTRPATEDRYNRISFVVEGPETSILYGGQTGRYVRLVLHEPRAAGEPPTLRIESFTHGAGWCCRRLERARDVEFAEPLAKAFGPLDPKSAQFEFKLWLTETAFEFSYGGKALWMSELGKDQVKVQRAKRR